MQLRGAGARDPCTP